MGKDGAKLSIHYIQSGNNFGFMVLTMSSPGPGIDPAALVVAAIDD